MLSWLCGAGWVQRELDALSLRVRITEANLASLQARVNALAELQKRPELNVPLSNFSERGKS